MSLATVSTVVIVVLPLLGVIAAMFAWFYKRGRQERALEDTQKSFALALNDNTTVIRELTVELRGFKDSTITRLHEHELRITVLEQAK